ncbi:MAG: uroporphyrinogen decarboxylase [Gemmatimonadetes bacterium]|nr:uroporphyrinogen decarboxylase [Gemmatimonadota bacterium]
MTPAEPRLLAACRRRPVDRIPVWFMRQAGRYLAEYRAVRAKHSILEICHTPELAAEVTLQPVEHLGVDAAILFADILLPVEPLGLGLSFSEGAGPLIERPIRAPEDVAALPDVDPPRDLGFVVEAVAACKHALAQRAPGTPLIGFAGAPFTLASYVIEGGSSRNFTLTKRFMYQHPEAWHELLRRLADLVGGLLGAQARAGADVVQLFDSWVGCLAPEDYRRFVLPHSRRAIELAQAAGVPVIHFGTDTATLLELLVEAGGEVMGVDWRIPIDQAWARTGDRAVQGNLDPAALFAPRPELETRVRDILQRVGGRPGFIFNLGHGILPGTPVDNVRAVVDLVHAFA